MKRTPWMLIGIAVVIVVLIIYTVGAYNRLVGLDQATQSTWSEVESQYQRQADLIPNLISVVSSSVRAETNFVQGVINARTQWQGAQTEQTRDAAGIAMSESILTLVNAVAEDYPVLQANTQYIALTDELSGTQNRITVARGRYISSIQSYNTATKRFPSVLIANMFGFTQKDYYHANPGALETPNLGNATLP